MVFSPSLQIPFHPLPFCDLDAQKHKQDALNQAQVTFGGANNSGQVERGPGGRVSALRETAMPTRV